MSKPVLLDWGSCVDALPLHPVEESPPQPRHLRRAFFPWGNLLMMAAQMGEDETMDALEQMREDTWRSFAEAKDPFLIMKHHSSHRVASAALAAFRVFVDPQLS